MKNLKVKFEILFLWCKMIEASPKEGEDIMKDNNVILSKSKSFALRIVRIYQILSTQRREYILSKQLLRSGTSIGANICESQCAQSSGDFYSKLFIAYKEASETLYWLELLYESNYLLQEEFFPLWQESHEIIRILATITKHHNS